MKIVLGVSGGIAAYKAPDLVRRLQDIGADVRVILTPNAARFVSPLSLSAVSNHGVIQDQWGDASQGGVDHIELARWAELLLIAPATANIIAKLAVGIADDALTTYAVAHRAPILIAPAMNTFMLGHVTVQENLERLRNRGVEIMEPDAGLLACGDEGAGRLPDVAVIVERVRQTFAARDLSGKKILVTAGPTREVLDPVRYLSNRSSGKMGYAIAAAARARGAEVTLVTGPTSITVPAGVSVTRVTSAQEMSDAVMALLPGQHVVIKAAAVADFMAESVAGQKIKKKGDQETIQITLNKTPDILGSLEKVNGQPFIVAFAAETESVEANARLKLEKKGADLMVANDVSDSAIGFDSDENEVLVITREGDTQRLARAPKTVIANQILDIVAAKIARTHPTPD